MMQLGWVLTEGGGPVVAVALHDGYEVRPEMAALLAVTETDRWREEDPFTATWTEIGNIRIVAKRSRFEVDLNRPKEKAVYLKPEEAWGLRVWRTHPPSDIIAHALADYEAFYTAIGRVFSDLTCRFGRFVVYDLHTYNHRRLGLHVPPAHPKYTPEVNLGTGTMNRTRWALVVERFLADMQGFEFFGRQLDVRENVRFRGGYFPYWVHQAFLKSARVLSVEMKKFFMGEWSNAVDLTQLEALRGALQSTVPGMLEALQSIGVRDRNRPVGNINYPYSKSN